MIYCLLLRRNVACQVATHRLLCCSESGPDSYAIVAKILSTPAAAVILELGVDFTFGEEPAHQS